MSSELEEEEKEVQPFLNGTTSKLHSFGITIHHTTHHNKVIPFPLA